jgi:ElaB/YqjD/DUF883 family membrane-anchored ribosome-binding protein
MSMENKTVQSGVTEAGEAVGEGVGNATSATAAATGQAERAVGEAGEAVQQTARQALSQASDVADDLLAAGRHAAQAATRQVNEQPLMAVIAGFALGYIASWLIHGHR